MKFGNSVKKIVSAFIITMTVHSSAYAGWISINGCNWHMPKIQGHSIDEIVVPEQNKIIMNNITCSDGKYAGTGDISLKPSENIEFKFNNATVRDGKLVGVIDGNVDVPFGNFNCTASTVDGDIDGKFHCTYQTVKYEFDDIIGSLSGKEKDAVIIYNDDSRYVGSVRWELSSQGLSRRDGKMSFANGDSFVGEFKESMNNTDSVIYGKGVYVAANGDKYEGDLVNNKKNGKGVFTWIDGNKYEGDFVDGNRTGKGLFTWATGDKYEGDFVNNNITGNGRFTWANGDYYYGDFVNNNLTGKGTVHWINGDWYYGDFVNDKRTGEGGFHWANGDRYSGYFVDGKMSGEGFYHHHDNTRYKGKFKDDKKQGEFFVIYADETSDRVTFDDDVAISSRNENNKRIKAENDRIEKRNETAETGAAIAVLGTIAIMGGIFKGVSNALSSASSSSSYSNSIPSSSLGSSSTSSSAQTTAYNNNDANVKQARQTLSKLRRGGATSSLAGTQDYTAFCSGGKGFNMYRRTNGEWATGGYGGGWGDKANKMSAEEFAAYVCGSP